MGGGGGGGFERRTPEQLRDLVRKTEEKTAMASFEAELSGLLNVLLASYNGRDVDGVRERLSEIKTILGDAIEGTVDQIFGGSVAKHTYVDGLSHVDSLIIVNDTTLEGAPDHALERMEAILRGNLEDRPKVSRGRMAVTLDYEDGMSIQLLPAVTEVDGRLRVPSSRNEGWSNIDPERFQQALTQRNQECGNKLIPTIKLAKAIIGQLPEAQRLSGYHIESLAIAAFRGYEGKKTPAAMLPTFFEKARELVLTPVSDSTGQSVHVDDDLGPANSEQRVTSSHILGRLARRMRNATLGGSSGQWSALFGLDE
jgi:hypothetical protein